MKLYVANRWAVVLEISFSWTQVYGWSKPRLNIICGGDLSASRPWSSYWHHLNSACSSIVVVVVQSLSHVRLFATPGAAALQASLSFTISQSLLKLTSIESVMPSNHLILCHPLLLLSSIFPSIKVFSNESALCIRWPKYWSFSFSINPSNEYSRLISFGMDWLDLLEVQGTLKSFLKSINSLVLSFLYSPNLTSIHDFEKP